VTPAPTPQNSAARIRASHDRLPSRRQEATGGGAGGRSAGPASTGHGDNVPV
jgi:hypothetical protein